MFEVAGLGKSLLHLWWSLTAAVIGRSLRLVETVVIHGQAQCPVVAVALGFCLGF